MFDVLNRCFLMGGLSSWGGGGEKRKVLKPWPPPDCPLTQQVNTRFHEALFNYIYRRESPDLSLVVFLLITGQTCCASSSSSRRGAPSSRGDSCSADLGRTEPGHRGQQTSGRRSRRGTWGHFTSWNIRRTGSNKLGYYIIGESLMAPLFTMFSH